LHGHRISPLPIVVFALTTGISLSSSTVTVVGDTVVGVPLKLFFHLLKQCLGLRHRVAVARHAISNRSVDTAWKRPDAVSQGIVAALTQCLVAFRDPFRQNGGIDLLLLLNLILRVRDLPFVHSFLGAGHVRFPALLLQLRL
jgi:hypothetical protein